jgi:hypothetical protein
MVFPREKIYTLRPVAVGSESFSRGPKFHIAVGALDDARHLHEVEVDISHHLRR